MNTARSWIFAALLVVSFTAGGSDFKYRAPPGWKVLLDQGRWTHESTSEVPSALMRDLSSGRYTLLALDPLSTDKERVGATLNVVETKDTGHITADDAKLAVTALVAELQRSRVPAAVVGTEMREINGVDVAVLTIDLMTADGVARRMRQYIAPGKKSGTVLTYQAPKDDFDKHVAEFEASARATKGMYDPGVFHVGEFLLMGIGGGVLGAIGGGIYALVRKRRKAAAGAVEENGALEATVPAKAPARRPSKHVWYCGDCGNPVPIRIEQCRCGGKKPA